MISIKEIRDLKTAEALWKALSPRETIFDEWDFRYCFYKYEPLKLCFLAAYEKNNNEETEDKLVGLLPLQKHPRYGFEFFAEDPSEESRPFIKLGYDYIIADLYAAIPGPAKCYDISGEDEFTVKLPLEDYSYILPLRGFNNFDDFLKARLSSKKSQNMRAEFRKVEVVKPEIIYNNFEDLDEIFKLSTAKFSDSYLQSEAERKPWKDLLSLSYNWQIVSLKVAGKIVAASLSVLFNGTYFYLINGTDKNSVPNLGKYLNKVNVERAIELKAEYWNAGLGDCNWKAAWHLDKIPQYLFEKI